MFKDKYFVLGVMSGTSLDGIDLCYAVFQKKTNWSFKIIKADTLPYDTHWVEKLSNASKLSQDEIHSLNHDYTKLLAETIQHFIATHRIDTLDAVCSHGHTVWHQPENGLTLQIGNLAQLSQMLRETLVCDFRVQDVALGGQGAPLVPIGDQLLFSHFEACLNLGGFANISFQREGARIAFDICAVNTVLNYYANRLNKAYDDKGIIAKSGKINDRLLEELNTLDYYKMQPPKSLGIEWVHASLFKILNASAAEASQMLATYTRHIAVQIAHIINTYNLKNVLVTGGGAFNTYLIASIAARTNCEIHIPEKELVGFKEALVFGFLGVLRLRDENNCLSSVTGAKHDHSSGNIFYPEKQY